METSKLISFILFFPGFLFSLSFHEAAHGWVASKFGDNTAKAMGRVTLNPLPHIDILGTVVLPALGFFIGGFIIGWGKPVPVDYRNLKNWKKDGLFIAAAGPLSNFLLALILAGVLHVIAFFKPEWMLPLNYNGFTIIGAIVQIFYLNLALLFFNLIPIHPLDGGKVMFGLLPQPWASKFDAFVGQYGTLILLMLFFTGFYRILVGVPLQMVARILL